MQKSMFELFLYISLEIWISFFIIGIGLILVDLILRLAVYGQYIFSELIIYVTDLGQFDIMLVDTMLLKFFKVGSPTLL